MAAENRRGAGERVLPVLAVAGWPTILNGYGSASDGPITSVLMRHEHPADAARIVEVKTELEEFERMGEQEVAREALESLLWIPFPPELSNATGGSYAGMTVALQLQRREQRRKAAEAIAQRASLTIDGTAQAFQLAITETAWAAARRQGGLLITITARQTRIDEVALEEFARSDRDT